MHRIMSPERLTPVVPEIVDAPDEETRLARLEGS